MVLNRIIALLSNSTRRMEEAWKLPHDTQWLKFMCKEAWLHLRLSLKLVWKVMRREKGKEDGHDTRSCL